MRLGFRYVSVSQLITSTPDKQIMTLRMFQSIKREHDVEYLRAQKNQTKKHVSHPVRPALTWSSIHGLDLFSRLQVPETDVSIEGAGGGDRPIVADVH